MYTVARSLLLPASASFSSTVLPSRGAFFPRSFFFATFSAPHSSEGTSSFRTASLPPGNVPQRGYFGRKKKNPSPPSSIEKHRIWDHLPQELKPTASKYDDASHRKHAVVSTFELFSVGVGPSSSHTVGPMRAANRWASYLKNDPELYARVDRIRVELFGSLALTGEGHGTLNAIIAGLCGEEVTVTDPDQISVRGERVRSSNRLPGLGGASADGGTPGKEVKFDDFVLHRDTFLPFHSNAMRFWALDHKSEMVHSDEYYSIGGGFIVQHGENPDESSVANLIEFPFPYRNGRELLEMCEATGKTIDEVVFMNECALRPAEEVRAGLLNLWKVMDESIRKGCSALGVLPGGLQVTRRAPRILARLAQTDPLSARKTGFTPDSKRNKMDWLSCYAIAVNEENACGGRVVTAPTNGAAGVIPSVLKYYTMFVHDADEDGIIKFLLTASAVGQLFKVNASISAAEVGCQGEIGVACSMAAAGLCAVLGGDPYQVENAAEIGMEHNLGLTCDPVQGLVQIPCIERNAIAAPKAVSAARLALHGDRTHRITLDQVIETMKQTGADMSHKYKETSLAGLAMHVPIC